MGWTRFILMHGNLVTIILIIKGLFIIYLFDLCNWYGAAVVCTYKKCQ